jgi:flagellar assembly protein FliH
MTKPAKYLFDDDFAGGSKPTITLVEHERRRADAESQAYRKGFTAGQEQAQAEINQHIANAMGVIASGLDRLHRALDSIEARLETEAVDVAVAVASKLAPELVAREPFAEISALATDCFRQIVNTPHIVVRVSTDVHEAAKEKLEQIARAHGFDGRLMVVPDAAISVGDCRIEWAEGGINRNREETLATINDAVSRYIGARIGAEN